MAEAPNANPTPVRSTCGATASETTHGSRLTALANWSAEMEKAKGARGSGSNQHQVRGRPQATAALRTLSDIGVSKQQSSDWQKLAAASFE